MAQFYGIPSSAAGCSSDATEPGAEAILDKLITTIPPVCAPADIIIGTDEVEPDQLLILEQLGEQDVRRPGLPREPLGCRFKSYARSFLAMKLPP